jgi:hypothetical protein
MNSRQVKRDALSTMFSFLQMGNQSADTETIERLQQDCQWLITAMTQKTAGQRKDKPNDVDFAELEARENFIILNALSLYLSGDLERLKKVMEEENGTD